MGGFGLDVGGHATVAEPLDDPFSGVSFSRRCGGPLDRGQLLDPAKGLFARIPDHTGNLPAGTPRAKRQLELEARVWLVE